MSHWTSRIALLAYVIGGWLLPAMHNHHHTRVGDSSCARSSCCDLGVTSTDTPVHSFENESECENCCDQQHEAVVASVDFDAELSKPIRLTTGQQPDECKGLCLLCSARSLCGDCVANRPAFCNLQLVYSEIRSSSLRHLLDQPLGSDPARGPALMV